VKKEGLSSSSTSTDGSRGERRDPRKKAFLFGDDRGTLELRERKKEKETYPLQQENIPQGCPAKLCSKTAGIRRKGRGTTPPSLSGNYRILAPQRGRNFIRGEGSKTLPFCKNNLTILKGGKKGGGERGTSLRCFGGASRTGGGKAL